MRLFSRRLLPLLALLLTTIVGPAAALEVLLETITPHQDGATSTQATSGWPLTFRAAVGGDLLIGVAVPLAGPFPIHEQTGFLLDAASAGCFTEVSEYSGGGDVADCLASTGATYIEFTPDFDAPGLLDRAGNEPVRLALINPFDSHPKVEKLNVVDDSLFLASIGPFTGAADVLDGYGYGADDDFPGLVIVADTGVGVALDRTLNRHSPSRAHNLAGFLTSVSYELDDVDDRTAVLAHLFVPEELFTPLVLVDACLGRRRSVKGVLDFERCGEAGSLRQIDGGPLLPGPPLESELTKIVTVRAFLVSGTAPSVLEDLNGDLTIDVDDAPIGYKVLSNEVVVTFMHVPCSGFCPPRASAFDLDRNGASGTLRTFNRAKPGATITKPPD